ncbi:MAG: hypothetical protein ACI4TE_07655 [Alphaproteobacteria bacterium]
MNQFLRKHFWLAAMVISISAPAANADDLFDDSFFADPAPVDAVKPADAPKTEPAVSADAAKPAEEVKTETPAPATEEANHSPANVQTPAAELSLEPELALPPAPVPASDPAPAPAESQLSLDIPAPLPDPATSLNTNIPPPPVNIPAPAAAPGLDFGSSGAGAMNLSTPPSEQILGKVSSDIFREMAEMERENSTLMLQLKREQLRSEIDALKTSNRQMLFDEIERREKMTQARLEWELAQDLKRQEALERKQRAEIRQKQIEAALKREEDRRIQKMKDEEVARIQKEKEEKEKIKQERAELKKKYDAASLVRLNNLKPILMAATRPAKIKRSASSRIPKALTSTGEDMLTKKKAGEALTTEIPAEGENQETKAREPASTLYAVSEIRGTAGALIAKLISKKDKTTFFAKKSTILPTGHTVIDIDKDFVLVQIGKDKEMIGFPSAGLLSDQPSAPAEQDRSQSAPQEQDDRDQQRAARRAERRRRSTPISANAGVGPSFSGASLAK